MSCIFSLLYNFKALLDEGGFTCLRKIVRELLYPNTNADPTFPLRQSINNEHDIAGRYGTRSIEPCLEINKAN